ncbi:MAG TPA: twin-arginine translocase TatA/TatE family subunit [Bryobacteraceae bacterium]|nr:twin-arginine translocase TatA/TatE family subunit [Bryobacteraceae bacterium]
MGPVGVQEMIVIFIVALVLFGPKKLPELGRTIGKAITEFRRAQAELKATFDHHMRELEKEAESVKEVTRSYTNDIYNHYDSNQYDSPYYDSGAYGSESYNTNTTPAESNPPTVSASAPQGAESTASHEAPVNGTVARTKGTETAATQHEPAESHPAPESAVS